MSATSERDRAADIAKSNPDAALLIARKIADPWFRAQALSWVLRFAHDDAEKIASEAAKAAGQCDDEYKRGAVRAWEIAALAERGMSLEARASLRAALAVALKAEPVGSRGESLFLLLQAACVIDRDEARKAFEALESCCVESPHWRCKRALRDAETILAGGLHPRPFFW